MPMRKESVSYRDALSSICCDVQLDASMDVVITWGPPAILGDPLLLVYIILFPLLVRMYFLGQLPLTLALLFSLVTTLWSVISRYFWSVLGSIQVVTFFILCGIRSRSSIVECAQWRIMSMHGVIVSLIASRRIWRTIKFKPTVTMTDWRHNNNR